MRIIGFSNASNEAFLSAPVLRLVPVITRLKTALRLKDLPGLERADHPAKPSMGSDKPAPSGHGVRDAEADSCATAYRGRLRVVREFDSTVSSDCAGRMMISGRMADVCAELDRLALRGSPVY